MRSIFGSPRPLEMRCFGPPSVLVDGREPAADVLWRKNLALLVYLALSPRRTRSRDHLLGLLWPEKEQARARHSLNEAVRRLRAGLGAHRLLTKRGAVTLNADALTVDALHDHALCGEFLEGLSLPDAPAFEHWLEQERTRFRTRALSVLLDSGELALSSSEFDAAQTIAQQALGIDAEAEAAVRLQMRAQALCGDASAALTTYRDFSRHIEREYGDPASRELRALAERIREGKWRRASLTHTDAEPTLVGRERQHRVVFGEVPAALADGPRAVVVAGGPGVGKTRLLSECVNRWRLEGGTTVLARPLEADRDVAWSTLRLIMRGGLLDAPGAAATDPTALRMLAAVEPRLADRFDPVPGLGRADVGSALGALLSAVADETPLALVLDDAHLADESTVSSLREALFTVTSHPVLVLLSINGETEGEHPGLTKLLGEVGRRVGGCSVSLQPFSEDETGALVERLAPWCREDEQRDRLSRRVYFETGGDPFLVVSLLRGLAEVSTLRDEALVWPRPNITMETPVPFDIPPLVKAATMERVHQLDDCARSVLIGACIGGPAIDAPRLSAVLDIPSEDAERALAQLERHRIISFDGERYFVEAALLREVVLGEQLTPGERRRLEQRFAAAEEPQAADRRQ